MGMTVGSWSGGSATFVAAGSTLVALSTVTNALGSAVAGSGARLPCTLEVAVVCTSAYVCEAESAEGGATITGRSFCWSASMQPESRKTTLHNIIADRTVPPHTSEAVDRFALGIGRNGFFTIV